MNKAQTLPFNYVSEKPGNGLSFEMVKIEGGPFDMGSDEYDSQKPIHKVTVPDFYLGKYPVTNAEFARFLNDYQSYKVKNGKYAGERIIEEQRWGMQLDNGQWKPAPGFEDHPIIYVTWYGAVTYCQWLSQESGHIYRLPSEAEWEYAARGGKYSQSFKYAGGNQLKEVGWYDQNSHSETKPVGLKQPNELGLYDMSGNVWEWCADHWHDNYKDAPQDGSAWEEGGDKDLRVLRGGSWNFDDINCRVSFRNGLGAVYRNLDFGFRVSRY